MKQINEINMATGETIEVAPNGVISRHIDRSLSCSGYNGAEDLLPEGWENFLAIRKMIIPANSWRTYPGFAWVWIDSNYNIGIKSINDTSWRVSNEAWNRAYDGTIRALVDDLRRTGKLEPLMAYVYCHNIGIYTTWSGRYELTIFHNGRKQWLSPSRWLGDKLLFMAAEDAAVPDGRFYVAKGAGKKLGDLIDEIESGEAYDEYWARRDADIVLGHTSNRRKQIETESAWDEIPMAKDAAIDCVCIPDELSKLIRMFKLDTQACDMVRYMVQDALLDGATPSVWGILEWVNSHKQWFKDRNLMKWYGRAISWIKERIGYVPIEISKICDLGNGWFDNDPHYKRRGTLYRIIDHNRGISTQLCTWPRCLHFRMMGYYTRKTIDGRVLFNPQVIYKSYLNGELISM